MQTGWQLIKQNFYHLDEKSGAMDASKTFTANIVLGSNGSAKQIK